MRGIRLIGTGERKVFYCEKNHRKKARYAKGGRRLRIPGAGRETPGDLFPFRGWNHPSKGALNP